MKSNTWLAITVALALARLLEKYGIGAKVIDAQRLRHGTLAPEDREGVQLICVSALDVRERSAHARFFVRRLKRSAPDTLVLGGFWQMDTESTADAAIIEVHPRPEKALKDGAQSLTPAAVASLMAALGKLSPVLGRRL